MCGDATPAHNAASQAGEPPMHAPQECILDTIRAQPSPVLYAPHSTFDAMTKIQSHVAKFSAEDFSRTSAAIEAYRPHIDFDVLDNL